MGTTTVEAVSVALLNTTDQLLLVRRGREPAANLWSFPGGKVRPGEEREVAARRELREETGVLARDLREIQTVDAVPGDGNTYRIFVFGGYFLGGHLRAGDDAREAKWVTRQEYESLDKTPGLDEVLKRWGWLP